MTKQRAKKYEVQEAVLKAIENRWKERTEIVKETGFGYSSVDEALKALYPSKVEKSETFDMKGNKIIKFRSKVSSDALDSEYLKFLINQYNSGLPEKYNRACREMIDLIYNSDKKILDKDFTDFVIQERLRDHSTIESGYDGGTQNFHYHFQTETPIVKWDDFFFELFSGLIYKLKKDIDKNLEESEKSRELLNYVKLKTVDIFENIALDENSNSSDRFRALHNLDSMEYQRNYLIAFNLLKKESKFLNFKLMKREKNRLIVFSSSLYLMIKSIIKSYYEINATDCMKRLWDAYDYQDNKKVKKRILKIIDEIRR